MKTFFNYMEEANLHSFKNKQLVNIKGNTLQFNDHTFYTIKGRFEIIDDPIGESLMRIGKQSNSIYLKFSNGSVIQIFK